MLIFISDFDSVPNTDSLVGWVTTHCPIGKTVVLDLAINKKHRKKCSYVVKHHISLFNTQRAGF